MDDKKEGILLVGTSMIILFAFLITVLAVMVIYRKRKLQHIGEIRYMNERFSGELLQAQMEVQQQTMQHIGQEIHDNVGQKLTLAVLYVQQLNIHDPDVQGKIDCIASIIHESLAELRSLSKSMTSPNYLHSDLTELVQEECRKVGSTGFCKVIFNSNTSQTGASEAVKSFVLRIIQEFLTNSIKHAKCTEIEVRFEKDEGSLRIWIQDDGNGFDLEHGMTEQAGIGISNMRRRASIIGAELTLESASGKGTHMHLCIPLQKLNT